MRRPKVLVLHARGGKESEGRVALLLIRLLGDGLDATTANLADDPDTEPLLDAARGADRILVLLSSELERSWERSIGPRIVAEARLGRMIVARTQSGDAEATLNAVDGLLHFDLSRPQTFEDEYADLVDCLRGHPAYRWLPGGEPSEEEANELLKKGGDASLDEVGDLLDGILESRELSSDRARGHGEPPPTEPVQVTTTSPSAVEPGARFQVEVVFHVEGYEVAAEEGRKVDENVATLALREGAKLTVRLVSVDEGAFAIDDPEAPLVWGPPSRKVDFRLRAAENLEDDVYDLRVEYWCGEVQLARTYLEITVGRQPEAGEGESAVTRRPLPRSAFASYAHIDKLAVASRVDSLKAVGIDVFLDSLDIRQGADWREVLERELLGRDSLLLFWSTAAKASEWVEKEWRFALDRRGLEGIIPNALEPANACPPPKELASLQFGSVLTELVKLWRRDAAG